MSKSLISVILVIIIAVVGILLGLGKKSEAPTLQAPITGEEQAQSVAVSHCGLTVQSPLSSSTVTSPITVSAVVDNTNAQVTGCSWTVFEAQAATIALVDANNTVLGTGLLTTTDDWMTTGPVSYSGTIVAQSPLLSGSALSLVFTEEDPSGMNMPDTLTVPVVAQ